MPTLSDEYKSFQPSPTGESKQDYPDAWGVDKLPNSEKLTPIERGIYNFLPRVSNSRVMQLLQDFNNSTAGKMLSYLDVGAEGLERAGGTALQLLTDRNVDLKSAWYAGSLFYDTLDLPKVTKGKDGLHVTIPNDLPGTAGLSQVRQSIQQYVSQGMTSTEALEKAKDDYYNSLGALALRSQMQDMVGHIFLDPVNVVAGAFKPVEALQARRATALNKSVYTAEELTKLANAAQSAGDLEKAARYADFASKVSTGEIKTVDRLDKLSIMLTGGTVLNRSKFGEVMEKIPLFKGFILSRESMAQEAVNVVSDNVSARIVGEFMDSPDGYKQAVQAIQRAAKGSLGPEFGHVVITPEGKGVQALLSGDATFAQSLLDDFEATAQHRGLLETLAKTLGESPTDILKHAEDSPEAMFKRVSLIPGMEQVIKSPEDLAVLAQTFKKIPYNQEMFMAHLMDGVETLAMRNSVLQFGVQERGVITRWSNAMKAAESLAFMKLNPAYPVRNMVNNEVTMLARGVWNLMSKDDIDAFWRTAGFFPKRMAEGFHAGSELGADLGKGVDAILREATEANGTPERVARFFRNIQLGKLDASSWARTLESHASRRAFTQGYKEFFAHHYRPTSLKDIVDGGTLDRLETASAGLSDQIDAAVRSSQGSVAKLKELLGGNLNISSQSVLDEASKSLGYKVEDFLGPEATAFLHEGLSDAIKSGNVEAFKNTLRAKIDTHVDDLFEQAVQDLIDSTEAQVRVGGPQVWYKKVADANLMWLNGEAEHAVRISPAVDAVKEAQALGDFEKSNALWRIIMDDDVKHFARYEKRMNAVYEGLERGWKASGLPNISEVRKTFNSIREEWRGFFEYRNNAYSDFFARKPAKEDFASEWGKLQNDLNTQYKKAVDVEERMSQLSDDAVAMLIQDAEQRKLFMAYRDQIANLRMSLRQDVQAFRDTLYDIPREQRAQAYRDFWKTRYDKINQMRYVETAGSSLMQGDPKAAEFFAQAPTQGEAKTVYELANQYGVPSATEGGARNDRRILNTVNKYGGQKYKQVADIPLEEAKKAFDLRATEKGTSKPQQFVADYKQLAPDPMPLDLITEEANVGKMQPAMDAIFQAADVQSRKAPALLQDLAPDLQEKVQTALRRLESESSDARLAATRFAEFRRDSALLNYNRRTNFDNWIGNVLPFAFWTTGSMQHWAVETLNRPAMLTNYLRMQRFLETAGAPENGFPTRLKGQIRIQLPFAPDWLGDQFIDPMRLAFPFKGFLQPLEQMQSNQLTLEGRAQRLLETDLRNGKITQKQYDDSVGTKDTPEWNNAVATAQQNDDSLKFDAWDFASLMSSPHAPLQWGWAMAQGHPEDIGPFSPADRVMRNAATALGVEDWNNSPYNIMGKIRKSLGLPAFDKWDDYRIDREISNLYSTRQYTAKQAQEAMSFSALVQQGKMTPEDAKQNPLYKEAVKRANIEYTGGKAGAVLGLLGLNVHSFPEGEENLRAVQGEFSKAYDTYRKANDKVQAFIDAHPEMDYYDALDAFAKQNPSVSRDAEALTKFFDKYPEYEMRLGLYDKPEEKLRKFTIDNMWATWNALPTITKNELKDQLGTAFEEQFVNRETRSYDSLSLEQMQMWLKLMGGNVPGKMDADQKLLTDFWSGQLKMTDPETAWRVQVFYDQRNSQFANWYDLQQTYYGPNKKSLTPGQMNELRSYWDWRRQFMSKNPDIVPYLTDNPKDIAKAQGAKRNPEQAVPTRSEIPLSPSMNTLLKNYSSGGELPNAARVQIRLLAQQYGMSERDMYGILGIPMP